MGVKWEKGRDFVVSTSGSHSKSLYHHFSGERAREQEQVCLPCFTNIHTYIQQHKIHNSLYKLQTNPLHLAVNHLNVNHDSKPSVIDSYFMTLELSTFLNPFEIYSTQCYFYPQTNVENRKNTLL